MRDRATKVRRNFAALLCLFTASCASIPEGKYGVSTVQIKGVKQFDKEALLACLATHKRPRFDVSLGPDPEPECGVPPFKTDRVPVDLWAWPWTDWPIYQQSLLERDLERIERWYRARGHYQAQVKRYRLIKDEENRELTVNIDLAEGKPVVIAEIDITGIEGLPLEVRRRTRDAISLQEGGRFDEAVYDASKKAMLGALAEASYANAVVKGRILIDPEPMQAAISFEVTPGPSCRFGTVRVEGSRDLPLGPIFGAADIRTGAVYSESKLKDAQDAIYSLGAFTSVEITPEPRPDGNVVDVLVRVTPGRRLRLAVGAGLEAGTRQGLLADQPEILPFWDVHLLLRAEHRNFLGGLRQLRIEERPRLIFSKGFPQTGDKARPGNLLMAEIKQPAFLEPRTVLIAAEEWDYGPDPYGGDFYRHDLDTSLGPARYFFRRALYAAIKLHLNLFSPQGKNAQNCLGDNLQSYYATFLDHSVRLDLRDNATRTTKGGYLGLSFQHAGYFLPSDWDYLRFAPEMRGYLPLPWHLVLAGRARLGILAITGSKIKGDQDLRDYGPYRYRLRGGGPNSVRGYDPNMLGDVRRLGNCVLSGGLRQWEASVELRMPTVVRFEHPEIDLGAVIFVDMGDVTVEKTFRFNYPQTTVGGGIRVNTLVGPLRFDMGFLPDGLQVFGKDNRPDPNIQKGKLFGLNGAWHLSIGEAF